MKELKLKIVWIAFGALFIALTFYLCLKEPSGDLPPFPHFDKVAHFTIYLLHCIWFGQIFKREKYRYMLMNFILMGLLIEFLQLQTDDRSFEAYDIVANTFGCFVGILFSIKYNQIFIKIESILKLK